MLSPPSPQLDLCLASVEIWREKPVEIIDECRRLRALPCLENRYRFASAQGARDELFPERIVEILGNGNFGWALISIGTFPSRSE